MIKTALALILLWIALPAGARAYSVLTHEALIDSAWDGSIRPLLQKRYPGTTSQDLLDARSFAYAGAMMQDMGYYPFGSKFFSNLIHYVRSGDFIECLLKQSRNVNEYAFALGALSHYTSDSTGHALATNHVVPLLYPELRRKYGNLVTYDEKPSAHIRVEFGFDVVQVARGNYLSDAYHDFIGFTIPKELVGRAISETYGLNLQDEFSDLDLAIGTFRWSVRGLIPDLTKVAWDRNKEEIMKASPGITRQKFLYAMPRKNYEAEWGTQFQKPGLFARFVGFLIRILPKIGPLKVFKLKALTPETEKMFLESYAASLKRFQEYVAEEQRGALDLANIDLDTGRESRPGEYPLTDETYAKLLDKLATSGFADVNADLRANILQFYSSPNAPLETRKHKKEWTRLLRQLQALKQSQP